MRNFIKSWNEKVDYIDSSINEIFGNKLPEWLENNMGKIYFIFFILTLFGIKEGYEQRGYFGIGGEVMIMLIPVMLKFCLEMRKDNINYWKNLEELEKLEEEER